MVTEVYDGIPVQVPRQGADSYHPAAQKIIRGLAGVMVNRLGPNCKINQIHITRVMREDNPKTCTVYYDLSYSRWKETGGQDEDRVG